MVQIRQTYKQKLPGFRKADDDDDDGDHHREFFLIRLFGPFFSILFSHFVCMCACL